MTGYFEAAMTGNGAVSWEVDAAHLLGEVGAVKHLAGRMAVSGTLKPDAGWVTGVGLQVDRVCCLVRVG